MENKHFDRIKKYLNHYIKKVKILNIKDIYEYNEPSLIHILEDRVKL